MKVYVTRGSIVYELIYKEGSIVFKFQIVCYLFILSFENQKSFISFFPINYNRKDAFRFASTIISFGFRR